MADIATPSNAYSTTTGVRSTSGESSSKAVDNRPSSSVKVPVSSVSRIIKENVKASIQDPSEVLPPPQGHSFFDVAAATQIIDLLSTVSVKRSSISQKFEQYQAQMMMQLFQAALTEAILEGDKANEEIKKAQAAISGAVIQLAIAMATIILVSALGAAAGMRAAGGGSGAKANTTVDDVSSTGNPSSPTAATTPSSPAAGITPKAAQVIKPDGSPTISETAPQAKPSSNSSLKPKVESARVAIGDSPKETAASSTTTKGTQDLVADSDQEIAHDTKQFNLEESEQNAQEIKQKDQDHWLTKLFEVALQSADPLVKIGNAANTIVTAQGKIKYYQNITEIEKAQSSTRTYKQLLESEVSTFKSALKDLNQSLDSTLDAIKEIARQSQEASALATNRRG